MTKSTQQPSNPFRVVQLRLTPKDSLLATATVICAEAVYLTGLRVIEGKSGPFVAMPSRKNPLGEYQDIYFGATRESRDLLKDAVLDAWRAEVSKAVAQVAA